MRIMIDTNIIISAIRNPNGTPFAAYAKASQSPYKIILCDQIVDEVRRVFNRKFPDSIPLIERFFTWALFEVVSTPGQEELDEKENMISSFIRPFGNRMAEIRMLVSIVIRMAFFPHFLPNFLDQVHYILLIL